MLDDMRAAPIAVAVSRLKQQTIFAFGH
jgi:hypothetical protein